MPQLPSVAVIADAHVHDINANYDWQGLAIDEAYLTLRSWQDTRRSSRVFNESMAALEAALHEIKTKGIKYVVLLGDYTDDGQIEATDRFVEFIQDYHDKSGIQFFTLPGNHDAYGPSGKHQSTRFARLPGDSVLVTSDPEVAAGEPHSATLTHKMFCETQESCLSKMSQFGYFRQAHYVHWESPFGHCDSLTSRQYKAQSADGSHEKFLLDASYLVEPVQGLWLLMIDANVFEPRNGHWKPTQKKAFHDSSEAGWNSILDNKAYLITWISNVCTRALQQGKTLLAFSHYPIIDPFNDKHDNAGRLFGNHEMLRRKPNTNVADTLLNAGLNIHFSGHLHIHALSYYSNGSAILKDYATPSLAAFPAAFNVVHSRSNRIDVDTIDIASESLDPRLIQFYTDECNALAITDSIEITQADQSVLSASSYGEFLYHRMQTRVIYHYLKKEWPDYISAWVLNTTSADLVKLLTSSPLSKANSNNKLQESHSCSMVRLISDWYCLRHANELALPYIDRQHFDLYIELAERFGDLTPMRVSNQKDFFTVFLGMMKLTLRQLANKR